jgi:hypothetical protein
MSTSATPQRSTIGSPFDGKTFLASHRAALACTREVGLFSKCLLSGIEQLHETGLIDKPATRQAPGHCIVQSGPVAITAAWLCRGQATIDNGVLLVIVWRGLVAPPFNRISTEHESPRRTPGLVKSLWEQSFRPVATSEPAWSWHPEGKTLGGFSSSELAANCVEQLRKAHERTPALPPAVPLEPDAVIIQSTSSARISRGR